MITELHVRGIRAIEDSGALPFGPITLIVGRNNAGKSTLLRSIYLLQEGNGWAPSDIRVGMASVTVDMKFDRLPLTAGGGQAIGRSGGLLRLEQSAGSGAPSVSFREDEHAQDMNVVLFPAVEPRNLIYPSFSRHWPVPREEQLRKDSTNLVRADGGNLVARMSTMADSRVHPGDEFAELCRRVFGDGLKLSLLTADNGQRIGAQIDRFSGIGLDAMGTGVGTILNLLVSLTDASDKIFLVEEPENDLHPEALKALLDIIVERSTANQFILTTHSNIVLTRLGSLASTRVVEVVGDGAAPPTTSCRPVTTREDRVEVLRSLGYELADLDLSEGWLIFEESSAEWICKSYLIPWFAPGLGKLQSIAAAGTSRVSRLVQNFAEMMLFAHLEPAYQRRAWAIVDGDRDGDEVVAGLRRRFADWPDDRFLQWTHDNFERFYPPAFSARVDEVLSYPHDARKDAKKKLLRDLLDWVAEDEPRAKEAFRTSASEAIEILRGIEMSLLLCTG